MNELITNQQHEHLSPKNAPSEDFDCSHENYQLTETLASLTTPDSSEKSTPHSDAMMHQSQLASPSIFLQTVVTYNESFTTSQERMEFAIKVCH
jgi:hypothetical protein